MFSLDIAVIAAMQLQNVHVLTLDVQCAASITKADKPSSSSTTISLSSVEGDTVVSCGTLNIALWYRTPIGSARVNRQLQIM